MRYAWDYTNEYLKENKIGFGIKGLFVRKTLHNIRIWDKIASDRVDKWIANSENVKLRIKKYYQKDCDVIFPAAAVENIKMNEDIPDDYYVIVSRLEPYKKVDLAIRAFNELKKPLIIIGVGSELRHLKSLASKNIEFLGWQSNKAVHEYMRNAKALIFPGEDDAGITPIESMACGRPVIAYNKGGTKECVKNGETGILFNNQTPNSIIDAVLTLENDYLKFPPKQCRARAEEFSEENFKRKFNKMLSDGYLEYRQGFKKNV